MYWPTRVISKRTWRVYVQLSKNIQSLPINKNRKRNLLGIVHFNSIPLLPKHPKDRYSPGSRLPEHRSTPIALDQSPLKQDINSSVPLAIQGIHQKNSVYFNDVLLIHFWNPHLNIIGAFVLLFKCCMEN